MAKIYEGIEELVGKTPLIRLKRIEEKYGACARIVAKLEYFNPAGSAKDRVAMAILNKAEADGILTKDSVVIEPTSGNTGIGLASLCASRGYRAIIVMPSTMSIERRKLMSAYGAELVLTDGALGMAGAIKKAEELAKEIPGGFVAGQFVNPANPTAHYETTGPEIYSDTDGEVDIFVAGVGTGGTISGVGRYLKEKKPCVKVIGVEPDTSAVLSGEKAGAHKLQGIGAGFIPEVLEREVIDEVVRMSAEGAFEMGREAARCEGILVGISSGAALAAAVEVAKRAENAGKTVVVLLPDTGERYLSSEMFS